MGRSLAVLLATLLIIVRAEEGNVVNFNFAGIIPARSCPSPSPCPTETPTPCPSPPPAPQVETSFLYLPNEDPLPIYRELRIAADRVNWLYELRADGLLPYGSYNGTEGEGTVGLATIEMLTATSAIRQYTIDPYLAAIPEIEITSVDDYETLYTPLVASLYGLPYGLGGRWKGDDFFAKQALTTQGWNLRQVEGALPFSLTDADIPGLLPPSTNLANELAQGRLYLSDFSLLDEIPPAPGKYVGGSVALYGLNAEDVLIALAIKPSISSPVMTPSDGADWTLAKINHNVAHFSVVQAVHFLRQHLIWEAVLTGLIRNLGETHPMRVLLSHPLKWCYIFYFLAAEVLLPTGSAFDLVISKGAQAEIPLLATSYSLYNFSESYFETELALKGVEDLPGFLYRDYGRVINTALETMLSGIVDLYYDTDSAVATDPEWQAFVAEVNPLIRGFPNAISTKADLVAFVTHTFFTVSAEHAMMNNRHDYLYSALPYSPGSLWAPLPTAKGTVTDENILSWLPNYELSLLQIGLTVEFSVLPDPANTLAGSLSQIGLGPAASPLFAEFQATLAALHLQVQAAATAEPVLPYVLPDPPYIPYWGWI